MAAGRGRGLRDDPPRAVRAAATAAMMVAVELFVFLSEIGAIP